MRIRINLSSEHHDLSGKSKSELFLSIIMIGLLGDSGGAIKNA
jgi:hypothetical protein